MNGRIQLKNMAFYGYHGHHPEESVRGQRFLVDLTLACDFAQAAATDQLGATVDYVQVYEVCRRIVERDRVKLLETLADRILTAVLAECPSVHRVEITIKKPGAPIPGVLDYVAVETSRERPERLDRPGQ
jgi:dihydroneopterin aldolase